MLALLLKQGWWIPSEFILASIAGTGIHLMELNLPAHELFISRSVLLFDTMVILKNRLHLGLIAGLATIARIFHFG